MSSIALSAQGMRSPLIYLTPPRSHYYLQKPTQLGTGEPGCKFSISQVTMLNIEGAGSVASFYRWRPERESNLPCGTQEARGRTGTEPRPPNSVPSVVSYCVHGTWGQKEWPGLQKLFPFPLRVKPLHGEEATSPRNTRFEPSSLRKILEESPLPICVSPQRRPKWTQAI